MSDLMHRRHILDYDSAVAMRYHAHRRGTLDALAKAGTATSLLLGTSAFAGLVVGSEAWVAAAKWLALAVAAVSAINLAFGVAEAGRKHGDLFKRWADLRADLVSIDMQDEVELRRLEIARAKLDGETPTQLGALSVLSENEEKEMRRSGRLSEMGWLQRTLAPYFTLPGWRPRPGQDAATV